MSEKKMTPEPFFKQPVPEKTIYLARWSARFWAFLIDIIIIILFLNIIRGIFDPFWKLPLLWDFGHVDVIATGIESLFFFAYWIVMEGFRGQSIGKMAMNLRVVNRDGTKIHYATAALESFPKAFLNFPFILILLPLDCLIGWLAMPAKNLRVFNLLSNTIVITVDYKDPHGIFYVREKE